MNDVFGVVPAVLVATKHSDTVTAFGRARARWTDPDGRRHSSLAQVRIDSDDQCEYAFSGLDYVYCVDITHAEPIIEIYYTWPYHLPNHREGLPGRLGTVCALAEWRRLAAFAAGWENVAR
jgi:hypothetical protein